MLEYDVILREIAKELKQFMVDALVDSGRVKDPRTSKTVKSIFVVADRVGTRAEIEVGFDESAGGGLPWIIDGRQPNQDPTNVAFAPIIAWVEDRNLDLNPYAVAHSIARNGYEGRPIFTQVAERITPKVDKFLIANPQIFSAAILAPFRKDKNVTIR